MKPNPFAGLELFAFDTETHLIQPGLLAPPLVCGSWAREAGKFPADGSGWQGIWDRAQTLKNLRWELEGDDVIIGHNVAYDLGVICAADPTLVPLVFAKYERDQIYDTMIAEQLIAIHEGTLGEGHSASGGGYSLEELGRKYLGSDRAAEKAGPDAWRLRYAELDGIPLDQWPEAAIAYPIRDARETYDIAVKQIADGRNLHDLPAQVRAHWVLHLSSMWGIRTDPAWVRPFTEKVTQEHLRSRARFLSAGLLKVNRCTKKDGVLEPADEIDEGALHLAHAQAKDPVRLQLLRKAMADVQAGKPCRYGTDKKALEAAVTAAYKGEPPRSSKGNIRTNKDTLWEAGDKLLEEFADAQENEKFFSTYLKVLAQGTVAPINPRINPLLETGRTSYSKPNLQNLPRGGEAGNPREGFVARPGTVFFSGDYPTLELRTLAGALELLGLQSAMADALRAKMDLHAQIASQVKGATYEDTVKAVEAKEQWAKDFRQMAKPVNFGLPGGLGPVKLVTFARQSYDARFCLLAGRETVCGREKHYDKRSKTTVCKACLEVAKELKETWFDAWPEMQFYFGQVQEWTSREVVEILDEDGIPEDMSIGSVTQVITERVRGRCNFCNGANTIFQGLAADIAKRALWLVSKEMYCDPKSPLWGSRIVVFVHDEIFAELSIENAPAAAERICRLMEQAFAEFLGPREGFRGIPCEVEPALMFRWYKDAFTAHDDRDDWDDRVVPVEKCPTCSKLAPVGWDGVVLSHSKEPCAGTGTRHPVAVARGLGQNRKEVTIAEQSA